jgi:UDP-glucose 4-epimerase
VLAAVASPADSLVLNIGSGVGTSLNELVRLAEEVTGVSAIVEREPDRGFDVPRVVLDISRARREIGLEPTPLDEGVQFTWCGASDARSALAQ